MKLFKSQESKTTGAKDKGKSAKTPPKKKTPIKDRIRGVVPAISFTSLSYKYNMNSPSSDNAPADALFLSSRADALLQKSKTDANAAPPPMTALPRSNSAAVNSGPVRWPTWQPANEPEDQDTISDDMSVLRLDDRHSHEEKQRKIRPSNSNVDLGNSSSKSKGKQKEVHQQQTPIAGSFTEHFDAPEQEQETFAETSLLGYATYYHHDRALHEELNPHLAKARPPAQPAGQWTWDEPCEPSSSIHPSERVKVSNTTQHNTELSVEDTLMLRRVRATFLSLRVQLETSLSSFEARICLGTPAEKMRQEMMQDIRGELALVRSGLALMEGQWKGSF